MNPKILKPMVYVKTVLIGVFALLLNNPVFLSQTMVKIVTIIDNISVIRLMKRDMKRSVKLKSFPYKLLTSIFKGDVMLPLFAATVAMELLRALFITTAFPESVPSRTKLT